MWREWQLGMSYDPFCNANLNKIFIHGPFGGFAIEQQLKYFPLIWMFHLNAFNKKKYRLNESA